jgi:hypothetical protein
MPFDERACENVTCKNRNARPSSLNPPSATRLHAPSHTHELALRSALCCSRTRRLFHPGDERRLRSTLTQGQAEFDGQQRGTAGDKAELTGRLKQAVEVPEVITDIRWLLPVLRQRLPSPSAEIPPAEGHINQGRMRPFSRQNCCLTWGTIRTTSPTHTPAKISNPVEISRSAPPESRAG